MKKYLSLITLAALGFTGLAHAHAHLHKSDPANNSTVTTAPKNIALEFNQAVQLTAVSLQKGDTKLQDLGPLPAAANKQYSLALPALDAGNYIVNWRALSADKHIMSGKVSFKIEPK